MDSTIFSNTGDVIALTNDIWTFVQTHPILTGVFATWLTATESMPFVKKVKSNGLLHMLLNAAIAGIKATTQKKGDK